MKNVVRVAILTCVLLAAATLAHAEGVWRLRAALGQSISDNAGRGSAVELAICAPVGEGIALGMESGLCYLRTAAVRSSYVVTAAGEPGRALSSLTDGITRHRAFFLGPMVRWGSTVHLLASYGMIDVLDERGSATAFIQGASVGVGLGRMRHLEPSAELRLRMASDHPFSSLASESGTSLTFTVGMQL